MSVKHSFPFLILTLLFAQLCLKAQVHPETGDRLAHTFSIVARDTATGEMAVGVQSHWFAVGTSVSWGESGTGVVATQSFINPAYGPNGLKLMAVGQSAEEALQFLLAADRGRAYRQVAFLDVNGTVSAYTGEKCISFASHQIGANFSVQANMMLTEDVVPAMSRAFVENSHLPIAERVLEVMKAAQAAGGDIRGKQSAVLLVVGPKPVSDEWKDKKIDLRVDDHKNPIQELERLLLVFRAYEHMNQGDLAIEHNDMEGALREYGAAEEMFPLNLEMKYWKAVALANNGRLQESLSIFQYVFERDKNWRELTRRLPAAGLLNLSETDLQKILIL
jgi:uncharacterized Ntn-hydrolase superfamily protein